MLGFSKKRFLITLGLSIIIWYISVVVQGISGFNAPFSSLLSEPCKLTGFPIAICLYPTSRTGSTWLIILINIFLWFWILHLFWGWFSKGNSREKSVR